MAAYTVCEEILEWGGVLNPASVTFLQSLAASGELPGYLIDVEALLRLDSSNRISHSQPTIYGDLLIESR